MVNRCLPAGTVNTYLHLLRKRLWTLEWRTTIIVHVTFAKNAHYTFTFTRIQFDRNYSVRQINEIVNSQALTRSHI